MYTILRNRTISKTTALFTVASFKRPGIRLSFERTTTLLPGGGGERRIGTATMFRKILPNYAIFSTVLSKIVALEIKRIHRATRVTGIPIGIGALGSISGNAKVLYGRLSLPDIFGSEQLSVTLFTAHIISHNNNNNNNNNNETKCLF